MRFGDRLRAFGAGIGLACALAGACAAAEDLPPLPEAPEEQMTSAVLSQCAGFYMALGALGGKSMSKEEEAAVMKPYLFLAFAAAHARKTETNGSALNIETVLPDVKRFSSAYHKRLIKRNSTTDPVLLHDASLCKALAQRVAPPESTKPPS